MTTAILAGVVTFRWHALIERLRNPVLMFDAAGLALFAVLGTGKALAFGEPSEIFRRIWVPLEGSLDARSLHLAAKLASLEALVRVAEPGDVVGLMCHAERQEVFDWLADRGASPDTPEELRRKVDRAVARG